MMKELKITRFALGVALIPGLLVSGHALAKDVFGVEPSAWENPAVSSINRLPARTYTVPLADERAAVGWDLEPASPYVKSLNGDWKISWCGAPSQRPLDFWKVDYDDSEWGTIDVPSCVELRGYGTPGYTNVRYPFALKFPRILDRQTEKPDYNPVSSYRTTFTVPDGWQGRRVVLRFDGVYSAYYVWVNGQKVGYAEDSKLPSEFDITSCLNFSNPSNVSNLLAVEVYRWCDGSYLEDQDMFRFSGIFRDVSLIALPKDGIRDFSVKTVPAGDYAHWKLEVEVEGQGQQRTEVSLFDAEGKKVCDLHSSTSTSHFDCSLPARAWSAENPCLYTLVVKKGSDVRAKKIGFKDVKVDAEGALRINGQVVKFRGVNRHEHSMVNGRSVSLKEMTDDVVLMKRANVNTVRTSHYPDHRLWYALCDKYGIYLCAEANVEAHEEDYKGNNVGRKDAFNDMIVERNRRHVMAYRNSPSVTIWSLGNECGHGPCFVNAERAVKAADPMKRPTHWERGNECCDVDAKMYCRVDWLYERAKWAKEPGSESGLCEWTGSPQHRHHPVFVSEYAHAMGNALGNFEEYWQAFYSSDVLSGGCVWDWVDQALVKAEDRLGPNGRRVRYWAFGGDWDEEPHDGPFCCNGVIRPDRKPTAKLAELAHVFRPFRLRLVDGGVEVWNTTAFTSSDAFRVRWELLSDGRVVDGGDWDLPTVAPWTKRVVALPKLKDGAGERFFNAYWELKEATPWAERGFCLGRDQVAMPGEKGKVKSEKAEGVIAVEEKTDDVTVADARLAAVFSRKTGTLCSLKMDGRVVLADVDGLVAGPRLGMNRAWTDNDGFIENGPWGQKETSSYNVFGLNQLAYHPGKLKVTRVADGAVTVSVVTRVNGRKSGGFEHAARYVFTGKGRLCIENRTKPFGTLPPILPRFGLGLKLDGRLENVSWYGRGPWENYCDRKTGSLVGLWRSTVTDLYEGYVRPQDNGYRSDVRWVALADKDGKGVRFTFAEPGYFQALHYDCEDLMFARHRRGEHRMQNIKPPRQEVCLNLDIRQTGLGGGSCGPSTLEKYRYAPQAEAWTLALEPVDGNADFQEMK